MSTHEEAERLGALHLALSTLLAKDSDSKALSALIQEYGEEDVKWMLNVIREDLDNG